MNYHDPETRHLLETRKRERDAEWLRGQVGEATYLRGLMILGYLPADARIELNLLKME